MPVLPSSPSSSSYFLSFLSSFHPRSGINILYTFSAPSTPSVFYHQPALCNTCSIWHNAHKTEPALGPTNFQLKDFLCSSPLLCEAAHSSSSCFEINEWWYTSMLPYAFILRTMTMYIYLYYFTLGDRGGTVVKVLVRFQMVSLEFFIDIKSFRSHYGPGVDSASNRNEYQEYFLGVKAAGA